MTREPTDAELAEAFASLRAAGRCTRHATLAAAMANPVALALLRLQARLAAEGRHSVAPLRQRAPVQAPEPAEAFLPADAPAVTPPWALPPKRKPRRGGRATAPRVTHAPAVAADDRKRAAAGDRDDA